MIALLCIHGLLSDPSDFNYILNSIKNKYNQVELIDLPGHGINQDIFNSQKVLEFVLNKYDNLSKKYEKIDIIGFSMGGVLASYISAKRNVNKLILLAPAFNYINLSNYKMNIIKKSKPYFKHKKLITKIKYSFVFIRLVHKIKKQLYKINCPICIIWGEDDFLVSKKSGDYLFDLTNNNFKSYVTLKNHNHYNILCSDNVCNIILSFLNN